MTDMSVRVMNRLQDGVIDWQEKRFRRHDFRQQQADIHRARMTCSADLPFHQTQDWTGGMQLNISSSGRNPVIRERQPRKRIVSGEGIRWDAALAALILIGILFAGVLLADLAVIGASARTVNKLGSKIETLESRNDQIRAEIELNSTSASVCTEAVKLDLISSNGARTIRLSAPADAQLTLSTADKAAENAELEGRMTSNAGD